MEETTTTGIYKSDLPRLIKMKIVYELGHGGKRVSGADYMHVLIAEKEAQYKRENKLK